MLVKELIAELKKYPEDVEVFMNINAPRQSWYPDFSASIDKLNFDIEENIVDLLPDPDS